MGAEVRPSLRAVWLGQELRKLREQAGLGVRGLGAAIGVQASMLSKKERGQVPASRGDIDDYLRGCHVHDPKRRDNLYKICRDVLLKGWWDGYVEDVAGELIDRIWLESKAVSIDTFETIAVPGLLQVPSYAEALMRMDAPDVCGDDMERWLEVRTTRQHILYKHFAVEFRAIIDQSVLMRRAGSVQDMREQLDYLLKVEGMDNVHLRVLPYSVGMHPGLTGAFELLTLESPYPKAGLLQVPGGDMCVEGKTVDSLTRTYNRLWDSCLSRAGSRKMILAERDKL